MRCLLLWSDGHSILRNWIGFSSVVGWICLDVDFYIWSFLGFALSLFGYGLQSTATSTHMVLLASIKLDSNVGSCPVEMRHEYMMTTTNVSL